MSMTQLVMRLSKANLDKVLADPDYFWTLRNEWRDTDKCVDIDKAWQGIHYLFTKNAWGGPKPERWIIFGEHPIPKMESGYGQAHYLNPSNVAEVWDVLSNVSEEDLKNRFDPQTFDKASIYPHIWHEGDQAFDYLMHFYRELKTLYQKAAEESEYVMMSIM